MSKKKKKPKSENKPRIKVLKKLTFNKHYKKKDNNNKDE